jgi:hypothetical protein
MFKDISNFSNVNDYLPILNGCVSADLIIIFLLYHGVFTPLKIYTLEDLKWESISNLFR